MSLFDRIVRSLDNILPSPPPDTAGEDEQAHLDLLEQSSARIRATVDAIREGNLIAASSTTEDLRANSELRYESLREGVSFASTGSTRIGAVAEQSRNMSHVERLQANKPPTGERSR